MNINRLGFTILFISLFAGAFAQKGYSEGYIITLKKDTIRGKVKDKTGLHIGPRKITFITGNGDENGYLPKDIRGYSKAGVVDYLIVKDDFTRNFARLTIDGDVKLFYIKKSGKYKGSRPNGVGGFKATQKPVPNYEYYLYNTESAKTTKVSQLEFKEQMSEYFADAAELKSMISNDELQYSDMETIVEKYNQWKEEQTSDL